MTFSEKLKNFWYYYKIHTVVFIVAILFIVFALKDCAAQSKPDLSAYFVTDCSFSDVTAETVRNEFQGIVSDINADGKTTVVIAQQTVSEEALAQAAIALYQTVMLELKNGEYQLYFLNDYYFDLYCQGQVLCDLSEFIDVSTETYSLNLKDNAYFEQLTGIKPSENINLCVRKADNESSVNLQKNAVKILNKFYTSK